MLIGLMSLPNGIVFVQFHPVAYMVKLNIEMSMADMIVKVARSSESDTFASDPSTHPQQSQHQRTFTEHHRNDDTNIGAKNTAVIGHSEADNAMREDIKGIARQTEVQVYVGDSDSDSRSDDIESGKPENRDFTHDRTDFVQASRNSRLSDDSQIPMKDLARP